MDLPIENGGSFHSYVNVYQRVRYHKASSNKPRNVLAPLSSALQLAFLAPPAALVPPALLAGLELLGLYPLASATPGGNHWGLPSSMTIFIAGRWLNRKRLEFVSWDDDIPFPTEWKIKFMFQTTNQIG